MMLDSRGMFSDDLLRCSSVVLLSGTPVDEAKDVMRFRLIYDGPLRSTQRDPIGGQRDPRAQEKHAIRKVFHKQLKHLWATERFLSHPDHASRGKEPLTERVAKNYHEYGYRFVPLVREEWALLCSLKVLFLRSDGPGSIIGQAGDIDNRIKTRKLPRQVDSPKLDSPAVISLGR